MLPLLLILLAAPPRVHLVDEPFEIPAHDWRFDSELGLHQRPAVLVAGYRVKSGGPVRLLLMSRDDVDRLSEGRPHSSMMALGPASYGSMRFAVSQPGDYALVIDNRDNSVPARVHLSVWIEFPRVSGISPARQLTVILLSFAFFFGVASWSARRLWKGIHSS